MRYDEQTLRPAIQAAYDHGGLDSVCRLVVDLLNEQEARHQAEIAKLEARIAEFEMRLNMNRSNSSKPPSSDGLKRKTKSLRRKNTGRKPGGQPGHTGQTLQQSPAPDIIHPLALDSCPQRSVDQAPDFNRMPRVMSLLVRSRVEYDSIAYLIVTQPPLNC